MIKVRLVPSENIKVRLKPAQGIKVGLKTTYLFDNTLIDDEVALAKDWAIKDTGKVIEEDEEIDYSSKAWAVGGTGTETNNSKYYAEQAAISESNASTSETNAAASALAASQDAGVASTKAGQAATSESNALSYSQSAASSANDASHSAADAYSSETSAASSAGTATTQAGIATSKATEASGYASNALASKNAAATSETNAQTWAEGIDSQVEALGGEHSSKGWAAVAKALVDSIGSVLHYKGSVATRADLPTTGQELGDMYNITSDGSNVVWNGSDWDDISGIVDLSAYRTAADQDAIDATKVSDVTVNGSSVVSSGVAALTVPTDLNSLSDTTISSATSGQVLMYDGSVWKNTSSTASVAWGGITGTLANQTDLQTALDGKADIAGTETITGDWTFTEPVTIQNGQGTGCLIVGANVNSSNLTNNQRKLARINAPSYANKDLGATLIGWDTSGDSDSPITNKSYDSVCFGGMKKITNCTSPMSITFCVTDTRAATAAANKKYALAMDSTEAIFGVQPKYNGYNLATMNDLPTVNNSTITIQKNGTDVDSFTTNASSNKSINITVPTTAADVSALPSSTKYGADLDYTNSTLTLLDQDGNALGNSVTISGGVNTNNLLDFKWVDHELNDQSWLKADTFSWQDGTVYSDAYDHLVADLNGLTETKSFKRYDNEDDETDYIWVLRGDDSLYIDVGDYVYEITNDIATKTYQITAKTTTTITVNSKTYEAGIGRDSMVDAGIIEDPQTETIGSYTISYYLADDGHKITTDETTVENIYDELGVAWYYVLDTVNTRFKLPRTKYGFTGYRDAVGNYVQAGVPNITGSVGAIRTSGGSSGSGALYKTKTSSYSYSGYSDSGGSDKVTISLNASNSNSIYGNSTTVQPPATQMYLYFYVGQFSQSATEQTAGLNASLFNEKVDIDSSWGFPSGTYDNLTLGASGTTYTAPANGYFFVSKKSTAANQWISIENTTTDLSSGGNAAASGNYERFFVPVKSGDVVVVNYNLAGDTMFFRFIYAEV